MKIIEKKYFVCEICGKTAQDEQKIIECQRGHHAISDECEIALHFKKGASVPNDMEIIWPDGMRAGYYLNYADASKVDKP